MSRWFRSYADTHRNPKVARLSDADFRLWHELLCVASENDGHIPPADDLKHLLNRRLDHLSKALKRLVDGRLIDALSDGYAPRNWSERQYKSDTSTPRVQKHRSKGNVSCNVSETAPDTETESEEKSPQPPEGGRRGKSVIPEDWQVPPVSELPPKARACAEQWTAESYATHAEAFGLYWRSERKMKADWRGTWANRVIALHGQVMRDQKFGNAPPGEKPEAKQPSAAELEDRAKFYDRIGKPDDAADCRRKAKALPIGQLIPFANIHAQAGAN